MFHKLCSFLFVCNCTLYNLRFCVSLSKGCLNVTDHWEDELQIPNGNQGWTRSCHLDKRKWNCKNSSSNSLKLKSQLLVIPAWESLESANASTTAEAHQLLGTVSPSEWIDLQRSQPFQGHPRRRNLESVPFGERRCRRSAGYFEEVAKHSVGNSQERQCSWQSESAFERGSRRCGKDYFRNKQKGVVRVSL